MKYNKCRKVYPDGRMVKSMVEYRKSFLRGYSGHIRRYGYDERIHPHTLQKSFSRSLKVKRALRDGWKDRYNLRWEWDGPDEV